MVGYFQNPVMETRFFFKSSTSEVTRTFVLTMKSVKYVRNTPES